jgi:hypothetical protein
VAVIRRDSSRLRQLSTAGHWHQGTLGWLHRLVDLTAETFRETTGWDPRKSLRTAARLQIACERAMNSLLLLSRVPVKLEHAGRTFAVEIRRDEWLGRCADLADEVCRTIELACERASLELERIDRCVTLGPILRIPQLRDRLFAGLSEDTPMDAVDRIEVARGAASCLAGELPGRGQASMPPASIASQSIGIVVEDARGRRRILPVIPRGTMLPARTNRKLTVGGNRPTMTLSLVESSGPRGDDWHSLGRHEFEVGDTAGPPTARKTCMIGFNLDINGLLAVRGQQPGTPGSFKLATLPEPTIADHEITAWMDWVNEHAR